MKTNGTKRLAKMDANNLYCAHCYVRVGIAERHLVKEGKPYHYACYAKLLKYAQTPPQARAS